MQSFWKFNQTTSRANIISNPSNVNIIFRSWSAYDSKHTFLFLYACISIIVHSYIMVVQARIKGNYGSNSKPPVIDIDFIEFIDMLWLLSVVLLFSCFWHDLVYDVRYSQKHTNIFKSSIQTVSFKWCCENSSSSWKYRMKLNLLIDYFIEIEEFLNGNSF